MKKYVVMQVSKTRRRELDEKYANFSKEHCEKALKIEDSGNNSSTPILHQLNVI